MLQKFLQNKKIRNLKNKKMTNAIFLFFRGMPATTKLRFCLCRVSARVSACASTRTRAISAEIAILPLTRGVQCGIISIGQYYSKERVRIAIFVADATQKATCHVLVRGSAPSTPDCLRIKISKTFSCFTIFTAGKLKNFCENFLPG